MVVVAKGRKELLPKYQEDATPSALELIGPHAVLSC